jgi:hypothetical protein
MAEDKKLQKYEVALDGKLITRDPPAKIGPNFQELKNMRYTKDLKGIKGVGGMSKINSSIINVDHYKTRSAIHFKKDFPSESHVLVEAMNSGETTSRIWQNTAAIPSAGNFSGTALYAPVANSDPEASESTMTAGQFSMAPDGDVAWCNREESCIWGGTEREIAGFISYDPGGSFSYDYTEEVRNIKTDASNKATLNPTTSGGIDGNAMVVLHLDNNVTNVAPTTPQTFTNNNVTFTTSGVVFGTHRAVFTTNAYLNASDDSDFDLSGGTFNIDFHLELDDLSSDYSIYYQNTAADTDSFNLMVDTNGAILVRIKSGGTKQFSGATDFSTANGVIVAGTDYHIELDHTVNSWYIFVNGALVASTSDAAEPANYTGDVQIGYDGTTYLEGKIDEYRVSNIVRHTANFEIPSAAYTDNSAEAYFYIGSIRPLDGFKLYVGTANTDTSTMAVYYWNGSAWTQVSNLTDNTASGGKSIAATGTVTFTTTKLTAKIKYIDGVLVYWYKVYVDTVSAGTSVYHATVSTPFQPIKDTWDGVPRLIDSFQIYAGSPLAYVEWTLNVRENEYVSTDAGTYATANSLATGTEYIVCGFTERMTGVNFKFVSAKGNDTAGTVASVFYWSGTAWTTVGDIDDGTIDGGISFAKSGAMTWDAPASTSEFVQSISNDANLYYYKFTFSKTFGTDVAVYHINGIPVQTDVGSYKFPAFANDRLWLCCDRKGRQNTAICSTQGTSSVFNGDDTVEFEFGDKTDLMGMAWLFSSVGSSLYNVMMFFKRNETWALIGDNLEEWTQGKYRVSSVVGCVAPHTIQVIDIGPQQAQTLNRNVVIWQAHDGIYMSDGRSPIKISGDIDDKFDPRATGSINTARAHQSVSFWDKYNKCYHWLWKSGSSTTCDQEWVFDFDKTGWFRVDRTTDLQYGINVTDTNGVG